MAKTYKMIVGPIQMPGTATTVYTSPAFTRTTITYIHITNSGSAPAGTFVMSKGVVGSYNVFYVAQTQANGIRADGGLFEKHVQFTLEPGELIQLVGDTTLAVTINGFTEVT